MMSQPQARPKSASAAPSASLRKKAGISKYFTAEFFLGVFLLVILVLLFFTAKGFYSLDNTMSILNTFSYLLISAIGMNLIILTSNIDVSAGPLISVVCIAIAALGKLGLGIWVLLPAAILTGMMLSFINGLFITKLRIPAIVATLATALLFSGVLPLVLEGSIYDLPATFTWLGFNAKLFGFLPASILIMLVITIPAILFMKYSKFSKQVYAVGNSYGSARLSGINTDRIVIVCYVIAGALYGISGTIIATASQRVTTTMGSGLEMSFIAAVALGGTSIAGGSGKLIGTVIGALILAIIPPATNYIGISSDWSDAIKGAIIIISVVVSATRIVRRRRQKTAAPVPAGGQSK